jgi:hypothetical protein
MFRRLFVGLCLVSLGGCEDKAEVSARHAREHVTVLAASVQTDVEEVRTGLPQGAKHLEPLYASETPPKENLPAVRLALETARGKVQDLRVAKSTFFALVDPEGNVLRNDQDQDLMVGKNVFSSFPALKQALSGKYVESRGSMPEAAAVKGPDGQWVAAQPVSVGGAVKGLYVTGWSWSAYAYRLENSIRGKVKSALGERDKEPLIYVYILVDDSVYGAPQSPEINARAIAEEKALDKLEGDAVHAAKREITGRDFGLAIRKTPVLGDRIGVAVLRSET